MLNAPECYRRIIGEVGVILVNFSGSQSVEPGERIAQLLPVTRCQLVEVDVLSQTERGRGFDSTGVKYCEEALSSAIRTNENGVGNLVCYRPRLSETV